MTVLEWLFDSDPAIRWQVLRDLVHAPAETVAAERARVPAGAALAVDRDVFSAEVHGKVTSHPRITVVRGENHALPTNGVIATGPLTSQALADAIAARLGTGSPVPVRYGA